MAREPITIVLEGEEPFDGSSLITGDRNSFEQSPGFPRTYRRNLTGNYGVVPADFWGLFTAHSPKVVSISGGNGDPLVTAAIIAENTTGTDFNRQLITLSPRLQHVLLGPHDRLALRTRDDTRPNRIELLVNDASESDHQAWARRYDASPVTRRFRISRSDNANFQHLPTGTVMISTADAWGWNFSARLNTSETDQSGPIPVSAFFDEPLDGAEMWVRFSGYTGAGAAKLYLVEGAQRYAFELEGSLSVAQWSRPFHVGFDDLISFETPTPEAGKFIFVDIEIGPQRHRRR